MEKLPNFLARSKFIPSLPAADRLARLGEGQRINRRLLTRGLAHLQQRLFELQDRLARLERKQ